MFWNMKIGKLADVSFVTHPRMCWTPVPYVVDPNNALVKADVASAFHCTEHACFELPGPTLDILIEYIWDAQYWKLPRWSGVQIGKHHTHLVGYVHTPPAVWWSDGSYSRLKREGLEGTQLDQRVTLSIRS